MLTAILALATFGLSAAGFLAGFPSGLLASVAGAGLLVFASYTLSKKSYVEYRNKR